MQAKTCGIYPRDLQSETRNTGKCSNMGDKPSFCQKKSLRTSALESKTKKPHSEKIQVEFGDCLSSCLGSWLSHSVNTVLHGHAWYDFPRLLPLLPGNPHPNPSLQWQLCLAYICVIHWTPSIPALTGPVSSQTSAFHMLASFLVSRLQAYVWRGLTHKEEITGRVKNIVLKLMS